MTGYDPSKLVELRNGFTDYYQELLDKTEFLIRNQNLFASSSRLISFEIAQNFTQLEKIIDAGKIGVILSVEGSNAFLDLSGSFQHFKELEKLGKHNSFTRILKQNIRDYKVKHPLFIATLAHHQFNLLCGHAESFISIAKTFFKTKW